MPTPRTAYAVPQTEIGLAIEVVRNSPVAPAFWVPVKGPKYKPNLTMIADDTLQGSMVKTYDLIPGLRYDSHGWDSYPYLDSFPVLLRCELGSPDTLTVAPVSTALSVAAVAGAATISTVGTVAAGSWIVVGTGSSMETHKTTGVTGAGPYTVTLQYPLLNAQAQTVAVTGLTGHTVSLLNNAGSGNQPPSATLTDFDGEEWRQLPAAQIDKLTIKGTATGLMDYSCTWFCNPAGTPTPPSASYSSARAVPGWTGQLMIGGTQIQYFVDWEVDLGRSLKTIPAITGTQEFFLFFADALAATGKLTVIEQSGAPELTAYLSGATESIDLVLMDTASGFALNLHSSRAKFKTGELSRGKEWVEVPLEIEFLPSATDATAGGKSPIQITVANAQITTY